MVSNDFSFSHKSHWRCVFQKISKPSLAKEFQLQLESHFTWQKKNLERKKFVKAHDSILQLLKSSRTLLFISWLFIELPHHFLKREVRSMSCCSFPDPKWWENEEPIPKVVEKRNKMHCSDICWKVFTL